MVLAQTWIKIKVKTVEERAKENGKDPIKEKPLDKFFIQQVMRKEIDNLKNMGKDNLTARLGGVRASYLPI